MLKLIRTLAILMLLCFASFPKATEAASLYEHQNTTVSATQTVEDVVVIGGDASIAGTVTNTVVIVGGDVRVRSSAHIKGAVVIIGGDLILEDGADVTNDVVNVSFDSATVNSLVLGSGLMIGYGAVKLAASLLMLILPVLIVLIGKRKADAFLDRYRHTPRGKLFAAGFFTGLMLAAVSVLLLLSIVGIPFILLVVLLALAALSIGLTIVSQTLGDQIRGTADKPEWMRAGAGAIMIVSAMNVPFVGGCLFLALLTYSLGIAMSWTVSKLRRR
ncbi:DUF2572 family protein [Cohnella ginsengisoli]|uniref:DUF2572 family protein n=1 Tax=Cohnella ginsengisoli TaxID=425004 RepID=A0A9X4KK99_9BACL|nr:hypothetical protein [Cohnella ginsengisoli]MDG0793812.1 DUF2572 family protein [Cohnella ginsengisoli]